MQQTQTHDRMYQELSPSLSCAVLEALEDDPLFDADQVRTAAEAYEAEILELQAAEKSDESEESAEESEAGEEGKEGGETASELEEFEAIIQEANALIDEALRLQEAATASEAGGGEEEEDKEPETAASPAMEGTPESAAVEPDVPDTEEDEDFVADVKKPAKPASRGKSGTARGGRKNG